MKRAVLWLGLAALVFLGIDALGDLTQDRPDAPKAGHRSEIVLHVEERSPHTSLVEAAEGLWALCQSTVHNRLVPPGMVALDDGRFRLLMDPAVGEHSWRRLKGCLEDMSLDQTVARVVSKADVPAAPS